MNGRIVWRVMWKEYRALRGLWIAVALASWMAQVAVFALSRDLGWFEIAWGAALVTPVFYALGAAAATFAGEREEGADRFLLALPVATTPLVTGKMLFLLLSTLAIVPAVALSAAATPWWPQGDLFDAGLQTIWGPAVLEVIAWGLLFSLLGRTVMQAAGLGAVAAALSVSVALWLTNDVVDQVDAEQYDNALFARLGIVGLVLLADLALARQWLRASLEGERSGFRAWVEGLQAARQRAVGWAVRPLRWQARLAWLAARQSAGVMALAVAAPIALGVFVPIRHGAWFTEWTEAGETQVVPVWEGNLVFLALLVGSMVFAADQRQRGYRLLAEQGASARAFWFSRQAIGLAVLLLGIVAWHLAWRAWHGGDLAPSRRVGSAAAGWTEWHGITAREWALVAMAYGVGQAMSLFFRSNIVGTLVALFAVVPFFVWYRFSTYLALPAAYTLWPLALGLLAATAVFAPRWLLDRRGPGTWLRVGGTFGFFACGVLAIVPELRLSDIPDVAVDFDPAKFRGTLGGEARETAMLYVDAMVAMKPLDPAIDDGLLDQHERSLLAESLRAALRTRLLSGAVTEADRQWLAANQRTIDLALEANAEPTCAFVGVPGAGELPYRTREDLVNLLLLRGVVAENSIEGAQAAIGDVLRLIRHIRPFPLSAAALERSALEFITAWSVWPGQTPERLLAMRELLVAYEQSLPNPNEIIKFHYLEAADRVTELDAYLMPVWDSWLRRAPWERVRAERLLNEVTNENLAVVDMTLANLQAGTSLEWLRNYQQLGLHDLRYQTTPAFRHNRFMQGMGFNLSIDAARRAASRRATQIILALGAFRLRTGALPTTLAELERSDPAPLPVDPYTGLSFRYFPKGFPITVRPNVRLGEVGAVSWSEGQPLLWSPGLEVQVTETQENGSPGPGYSVADERGNFVKVENGLGAWVAGLSFRIPQ